MGWDRILKAPTESNSTTPLLLDPLLLSTFDVIAGSEGAKPEWKIEAATLEGGVTIGFLTTPAVPEFRGALACYVP